MHYYCVCVAIVNEIRSKLVILITIDDLCTPLKGTAVPDWLFCFKCILPTQVKYSLSVIVTFYSISNQSYPVDKWL